MTATPPKPMVVEVLTGPPGCGKSHRMREEAIAQPGLYVFFMPTIGLLKEQVTRFRAAAAQLPLYEAHSKSGKGTVERKLNDARTSIAEAGLTHAIIYTTHDALISRDLSDFTGWHARVDEAPNATASGHVNIGESWTWFNEHFRLDAVDEEWWSAEPKKPLPGWKEIEADSLLTPVIDIIKRAASPSGLFVDTPKWTAKKRVGWAAIWTPRSLDGFSSCKIAGASYDRSLGALVSQKLFGSSLRFVINRIPMPRTGHPTVRIHYFTEAHEPSTTLWKSSEGRYCIKAVADHLGTVPLGYWSGNEEVLKLMDWRANGEQTRPKVEGREEWVKHKSCAFIYSSGPTPADRPIMDRFTITEAEVRRAREEEDILQYVMRGAIRRRDFDGDYDIYVYAKRQADTLAARLQASAVGTIHVLPVDEAGLIARQGKGGSAKSPQRVNPASGGPITVQGAFGKPIKPKSLARSRQRAKAASGSPPKPKGRPRKTP